MFRTGLSTKMAAVASDWPNHFISAKCWTHWRNLTGSKYLTSSTVLFRADRSAKTTALTSDSLSTHWLLPCNRWSEYDEIWQKRKSWTSSTKFVFRVELSTKIAAIASDWLNHIQLLCNAERTDETRQVTSALRPQQSLCFSDRSINKKWPSCTLIG